MKKTRKILATLLTFAMLFGTTLSVRAERRIALECFDGVVTGINVGQTLYGGDELEYAHGDVVNVMEVRIWDPDNSNFTLLADSGSPIQILLPLLPPGNNYKVLNYNVGTLTGDDSYRIISIMLEIIPPTPDTSDDPSPSEPISPSTEPAVPESKPHEHFYSWETVQEATTEQDGIEEYRCSCGDVKERSVIPASQVFVKGLYGEIKNAPLNGTVTFDSGRLYIMSDYIVKKLSERSDVTTVITFEYNKTAYKMTIPAGVDYSAFLADDDYFYGYFYFAKITGSTIEEVSK